MTTSPTRSAVDPRGMRFVAAVSAVVLAVVLLTRSPVLLAVQAVFFAVGALAGVRRSPYAIVFARVVRPRIGPPAELEDARPPRFAQGVGLVFAVVGVVGFGTGLPAVGLVATACAFVAAFLNAVFGLCLGCELYLTLVRLTPQAASGPYVHTSAPSAAGSDGHNIIPTTHSTSPDRSRGGDTTATIRAAERATTTEVSA